MSVIVTLPGGPYLPSGRPNTQRSNPRDVEQLAEPLRTRIRALIADCPHRGELGLVSGFRDPGRQWDLRAERVGPAKAYVSPPTGKPVTGVPARWNGTAWVGGSQHQHGRAADLGGTERAERWARDNRERYGLALTVPSEDWHYEADRRDVRTGRVHNKPTALTDPPPTDPGDDEMSSQEHAELTARIDKLEHRVNGTALVVEWCRRELARLTDLIRLVGAVVAKQAGEADAARVKDAVAAKPDGPAE